MSNYSVETSSAQLRQELQEIKERLSTIESIQSYVHRKELIEILEIGVDGKSARKRIIALCEEPKTKQELVEALGLNSTQSLDYNLTPIREQHSLIEETVKDGVIAFVQSRALRKLPKSELRRLLS